MVWGAVAAAGISMASSAYGSSKAAKAARSAGYYNAKQIQAETKAQTPAAIEPSVVHEPRRADGTY